MFATTNESKEEFVVCESSGTHEDDCEKQLLRMSKKMMTDDLATNFNNNQRDNNRNNNNSNNNNNFNNSFNSVPEELDNVNPTIKPELGRQLSPGNPPRSPQLGTTIGPSNRLLIRRPSLRRKSKVGDARSRDGKSNGSMSGDYSSDDEDYDDNDHDHDNVDDCEGFAFLYNKMNERKIKKKQLQLQIAHREDVAIRRLKLMFFLFLVASGVITCILVNKYLHNQEADEFVIQYNHLADQVVEKLHSNARTKMEAISALALQVQAYAIHSGSEWPYVTMPYFEQHVASVKSLTDAYAVQLFPIVTKDQRTEWENYSVQNNDWINASFDAQFALYNTTNDKPVFNTTWFDSLWGVYYIEDIPNITRPDFEKANGMADQIFSTSHTGIYNESLDPYVDPSDGPYFPQWQAAPMSWYYQISINLNYGIFDDFLECTNITQTYKEACLGVAWTQELGLGYITTMLYPIFREFARSPTTINTTTVENDDDEGTNTTVGGVDSNVSNSSSNSNRSTGSEVVAFLAVDIHWESYLEQILSPAAKKIYVVVNSTCDDFFTIKIIGQDAIPLGVNETRETKFDNSMSVRTRFGEGLYRTNMMNFTPNSSTEEQDAQDRMSSYIGSSLYDGFCQYDFTIYPSTELEDDYITNQPKIATLCVALMFFLSITLFMVYDCLVERRQRLVLRSALVSDSIVSSLFPSNVKDQLYAEKHTEHGDKSNSMTEVGNAFIIKAQPLHHTTTGPSKDDTTIDTVAGEHYGSTASIHSNVTKLALGNASPDTKMVDNNNAATTTIGSMNNAITKTIADLYPDATVLFADIAGFTEWCSTRQPVEVFFLLETLYGAFDTIAGRRNVFKIETIGDCYVAVTGLPQPQPDHAIIMVRFANDILRKTKSELCETIGPALGTDSIHLELRIGVNSGPVIAGVLRGDKARFQLFGDTMNTASRMESNGTRGRIHVSQTTADLLTAAGKKHWLSERHDMIEAKGKGKMQTYWVRLIRDKSNRSFSKSHKHPQSPQQHVENVFAKLSEIQELPLALEDEDESDSEESIPVRVANSSIEQQESVVTIANQTKDSMEHWNDNL